MFVVNDFDGDVDFEIPGTGSGSLQKNQAAKVDTNDTLLKVTASGRPEASATIANSGTYTVNSSGTIDAGSGVPAIAGKCAYTWNGSAWTIANPGSCETCPSTTGGEEPSISTMVTYTECG